MDYYLYKLNFTTPLHIGKSSGATSLDDGQMNIHADTLFAALCSEAVKVGKLEELYRYFSDNLITISDALPYKGEELYLPKPILYIKEIKKTNKLANKKALKDLEYIPLSGFKNYLQFITQGTDFNPDNYKAIFGHMTVNSRVAIKGQTPPLPYHVAAFNFNKDCGLYIILKSKDSKGIALFENLLNRLGLSGIGGKQSTGWGKFQVHQDQLHNELVDILKDQEAKYQMTLGTFLPKDEELEQALTDSWYSLLRRGGFVRSATYSSSQLKKRTIYMLAPGSCLSSRYEGEIFDLSADGNHPVWRNGKTLFIGVNI